jgi:tripartite-type tricarboxylate transporter receptor subunit TctC
MRVRTLVLSLLAAIFGAASVSADYYPDRPVRIIVPVAAGGGVDVMARMLAQKLSERWNQQVRCGKSARRGRHYRQQGGDRLCARWLRAQH